MFHHLYPALSPYRTGMLPVDGRHVLYYEESGNPKGLPVVCLHGGPGAGAQAVYRRFFDPAYWRIILYDQRGAGRSLPYAEVEDNTTPHLVADLETLRRHLGVDRWLVFGGSWGATLALAYGVAFPGSCLGFILRGIFLGRRAETEWFLRGLARFFPEAWRKFAAALPVEERDALLANYYRRLTDPDPAVHMPAARAWSHYEGSCSTLLPRSSGGGGVSEGGEGAALALARLEAHYLIHDVFMEEDAILSGLARLQSHPATLVQGRYDMICPVATADEVSRAWPEAEYVIVPDAGHSALEPGIIAALVAAAERMKVRNLLQSH